MAHSVSALYPPSQRMLRDRLAVLEGRDRPARFPHPPWTTYLAPFQWVHLKAVGRFWGPDSRPERARQELLRRIADLLTGLHPLGCPIGFLLLGQERQLQVLFGVAADEGAPVLEAALAAALPGARLVWLADGPGPALEELPLVHLLHGIPAARLEPEAPAKEQTDRLVRGLVYGPPWAWLALATPVPAGELHALCDAWARAMEQAALEFGQRGTAAEYDRQAQHYLELLEAAFQRFTAAKARGLWWSQAFVLGQDAAAVTLALAAFAGSDGRPEPLAATPCDPSGGAFTPSHDHLTPLHSQELAVLMQPPLEEYPGYAVEAYARFDVALSPLPPKVGGNRGRPARTLRLGYVQDGTRPTGQPLEVEVDRLAGHALIVGTTDSGKTNTAFWLLEQAHRHQVPFLVIEPVKGEYRFLQGAFPELQAFTLGGGEQPLAINPLYVPPGIPVQSHLDSLMALFNASFVLYPPMPYVLEQALHQVYLDRGWDLAADRCWRDEERHPRAFPTLTDLIHKVEEMVDRLGYDVRVTMDVRAGLRTRLNSLRVGRKGMTLDTRRTPDFDALLQRPTVLEMGAVTDDDQKAFLMGLILIRLYEHRIAQGISVAEAPLRHLTLIEEAHRLLENVPQTYNPDVANPKARAVQAFAHLLAEVRAYGEGLIIVEQSPTKLTPDVLKNTNTKIAHRIVAGDDREALAQAMNLDPAQQEVLVALGRGEAVVFSPEMDRPVRLRVPSCKSRLASSGAVTRPPATGAASLKEQARTLVSDRALQRAFDGWALSVACAGTASLPGAMDRLRRALRRSAPIALRQQEMEDTLLKALIPILADHLASRLGRLYGWRFREEEEMAVQLEALWADGAGQWEGGEEFSRRLEGLTAVAIRPFPGCDLCPLPCRYRAFIEPWASDGDAAGAFEETLRQTSMAQHDPAWGQLARQALSFVASLLDPVVPLVHRHGAALCYALQLLVPRGWEARLASQAAAHLFAALNQWGGDHAQPDTSAL